MMEEARRRGITLTDFVWELISEGLGRIGKQNNVNPDKPFSIKKEENSKTKEQTQDDIEIIPMLDGSGWLCGKCGFKTSLEGAMEIHLKEKHSPAHARDGM